MSVVGKKLAGLAAGPGPRLAAMQGGIPMFGMNLDSGDSDRHVVVSLRGELDLADAAAVAAALGPLAARPVDHLAAPQPPVRRVLSLILGG
jgi:hypothetical protein